MGDISFGGTVEMLKNAMSGASTAHGAIANNIAYVNTPNFKRTDVTFKESLAAMLPREEPSDELVMVTTSEKHIQAGPDFEPKPFGITETLDETQQMRLDGSNVDVDQEMAKLAINSSYAQTMGTMLGSQYTRMRQVITDRI